MKTREIVEKALFKFALVKDRKEELQAVANYCVELTKQEILKDIGKYQEAFEIYEEKKENQELIRLCRELKKKIGD